MNLSFEFTLHIRKQKIGVVRAAPFDVYLDKHNVVQPDILFVSNERKHLISTRGLEGAPDFAVEILSSKKNVDRRDKKVLYAKYGVREYWIIDPEMETVEMYNLKDEELQLVGEFLKTGLLSSSVVDGFEIELEELFFNDEQ